MDSIYEDILNPLVNGWLGKIDIAVDHKRAQFQDVADQCMQFFSGLVGFMYDQKFQKKYIGGNFSPKFKITLNKAFEIIAIFSPLIYNRNPFREISPPENINFGPEVFGDPDDPTIQALYQQAMERERRRRSILKSGCQVAERYFNYTPSEQPNGGLKQASEDACTEALIKGRGVLWTEAYTMPHSDRVLTGSFYDTVNRLLIDPDSESSNFGEAYWIARLCIEPHWKTERNRGLPYGSLRNKNGIESAESIGAQQGNPRGKREHERGATFDLIRYWKIWSIGGVGSRLTGTAKDVQAAFDDVVGDYAYLEIARGVPWPLNISKDKFLNATDDDIRHAFSWPVPYWRDQRWPCVWLDFYRNPNSSWPISPLRPGLGELVALNIIMSRLTYHVYQNTRNLIAVLKSAQKDVEAALKSSEDEVVFGIPEILKDIDQLIKFIQGPNVNYDIFKIIEHLFLLFDKRVGLSDLMYALNPGAASRTAPDAETKQQMLSVRPDHMAQKVEAWQIDVARNEKICAYYSEVNGHSVKPLLGDIGAYIFEQTFTNADEETMLREMNCSVSAGSIRKPNRQRDAANLKEIYQPMSIQLSQYAQITGDYTKLDELNKRLGEAMEVDLDGLEMGQLPPPAPAKPPPPDPAQEAMAEKQRQDMAIQAAKSQQKLQIADVEHRQRTQQQAEAHAADMMMKLAKARLARMNKGTAA